LSLAQNRYENGDQLGAGTYGTAYLCYAFANNTHESADYMRLYVKEQRPLVIKVLKPGHGADLLPREIQVLRALRGVPYALQLLDIVNVGSLNGLVFPYTNNSYYRDLYPRMTAHDVREWMRKVLVALDGAHSRGIVHMDLKPINIFYDHSTGDLQLGDWGLSMFYRHNMSHSWRTMTVYWKAPEVFLGHRTTRSPVDMWSIGACFAGMIVGRYHFFDGKKRLRDCAVVDRAHRHRRVGRVCAQVSALTCCRRGRAATRRGGAIRRRGSGTCATRIDT
jgi:serine/threonine protein kinase